MIKNHKKKGMHKMESLEDKNNRSISTRKKTTMPEGLFDNDVSKMNKELIKLLGGSKSKPLILTIISVYKDKGSCYKGEYIEREFYNNNNKAIAIYKGNEDNFNGFVEGYIKALNDNGIKYKINEEVCVD